MPGKKQDSAALAAHNMVYGARAKAYGPVEENFQRIADIANVMLKGKLAEPLTPGDVATLLICVKMGREVHLPSRDNRVDIAGYADLREQLAGLDLL